MYRIALNIEHDPIAGIEEHLGGTTCSAPVLSLLVLLEDQTDIADAVAPGPKLPWSSTRLVEDRGR